MAQVKAKQLDTLRKLGIIREGVSIETMRAKTEALNPPGTDLPPEEAEEGPKLDK